MSDDQMSQFAFENSLTTALNRGAEHQYKLRAMEGVSGALLERLFGDDKPKRRGDLLMQLEILKRKRELGLPTDSEDLENLLNEPVTLMDPGRAVAFGAAAAGSKAPLLKLGASPWFGGFEHGKLGAIARIFRK